MQALERHKNGTIKRADGKGDPWANKHRTALGKHNYMTDADVMFGGMAFGQNTSERLFMEYAPDDYENRNAAAREFALIAMFDRKKTMHAATMDQSVLSNQYYRWVCRKVGDSQPVAPRFFYVIGDDDPPWQMQEVDISTGEFLPDPAVIDSHSNWRQVWSEIGLSDARQALLRWVGKK